MTTCAFGNPWLDACEIWTPLTVFRARCIVASYTLTIDDSHRHLHSNHCKQPLRFIQLWIRVGTRRVHAHCAPVLNAMHNCLLHGETKNCLQLHHSPPRPTFFALCSYRNLHQKSSVYTFFLVATAYVVKRHAHTYTKRQGPQLEAAARPSLPSGE
jgi:hypothetical protein